MLAFRSLLVVILIALSTAVAAVADEQQSGRPFAAVYPVIVRTREGTAFDLAARDAIVRALSERLGVRVVARDRTVAFQLPQQQTQWALFQAGLAALREQLASDLTAADHTIVVEYLVAPTPRGGETVAGIQGYMFDSNGDTTESGVANSHDPAFRSAIVSVGSPAQRKLLIARTTDYAIGEIVDQLKGNPEKRAKR